MTVMQKSKSAKRCREKSALTKSDRKWLRAFLRAQMKAGMAPDNNEVATQAGATRQAADLALKQLVKKGELVRVGRYRGYRLAKKSARKKVA